ncbi:hypothetical protein REPUB_Repub07fG0000400 [Reevesia pubescens]
MKVMVLESRDRIGGRVHTNYSFGFLVDLGASWLHGVSKENPLAPLINWLGLPLYRTSGDNFMLYDHDLESKLREGMTMVKARRKGTTTMVKAKG